MRMKVKKFEKIYKTILPSIFNQIKLTAQEYKKNEKFQNKQQHDWRQTKNLFYCRCR